MGTGTNVYSVLFQGGALIGFVILVVYLIKIWMRVINKGIEGVEEDAYAMPVIKTIVSVVIFIVALTIGWNLKQSVTTTSEVGYKTPAAIAEQKKIQESQMPTPEEFDAVREAQKERAYTKPHEAALDSFNEKMRKEAEKIKERSIDNN